jgi:peptidoglycan/xylan/chitin deacetylase (PgdA/CDA1 family)
MNGLAGKSGKPEGALVISLDLELYWGVRDVIGPDSAYWRNLRGEREAIRRLLELFEEFEIAATWATVGFLFAGSEADADRFIPAVKPEYADLNLSPYTEFERPTRPEDIYLFAPDVVDAIAATPRQEVATHTFSHYYCCEPGQTKEAFRADLESARKAAAARGIEIRSIVFPRNQYNPAYDDILLENGVICYRGNQRAGMYQYGVKNVETPVNRAARLADTFVNVSGPNTWAWADVWKGRLGNVPASMFLRPVRGGFGVLESLQFRRIANSLEDAAYNGSIFHLWWHPHNFGARTDENIAFLRRILEHFRLLARDRGMRSMTMAEAATEAKAISGGSSAS